MLAAADAGLIKAGRRDGILAGACKAPQAVYKRLGRLGRVSGKSPNWMPHCRHSALPCRAIPGYSSLVINGGVGKMTLVASIVPPLFGIAAAITSTIDPLLDVASIVPPPFGGG